MQFIFDHLSAIILSFAVLLILATTQIQAQRSGLEQTASYATKTKALSFGEWLEDDVLSIGENFGSNRFRFDAPVLDTLGNATRFMFFADDVDGVTSDTTRMMTRYDLESLGSVQRRGETINLFQVHRSTATSPVTNGTAPVPPDEDWVLDGHSMATLSSFEIGLLDRMGRVTTDVERADFIRIKFSLIPQFPIEPEYLRELYWSTTLKVRPFWEPAPA